MTKIIVRTNPNLALIKYWGKRDEALMLPTKSSLSVGLNALTTETIITQAEDRDHIKLTFSHSVEAVQKIQSFINLFRTTYGVKNYFSISSSNDFPTAAGLASSSSGFAALALGLATASNLNLDDRQLSILARRGSGSAARSIAGGIVIWHKGQLPDGTDCYAEQLFDQHHWPELRILIIIVNDNEKKISSRDAMRLTVATSPSYQNWVASSEDRLEEMITAIKAKDFTSVGKLAEQDWYGMHDAMRDTTPSLDYWTSTSYTVIETVKQLRAQGHNCFFTTDAGPNVFVCCHKDNVAIIKQTLASLPGVLGSIESTVAGKPTVTTL
ncbi:MAG: diphosphomevalonate decarboxylase [Candidatus Babeliales bacterium]